MPRNKHWLIWMLIPIMLTLASLSSAHALALWQPASTPTATPTPTPDGVICQLGMGTPANRPTDGVPTRTATRTSTPVGPTTTPTRTSTPGGPTTTPTRTSTPGGPANTPTRTVTPSGPANTPTRTTTPGPSLTPRTPTISSPTPTGSGPTPTPPGGAEVSYQVTYTLFTQWNTGFEAGVEIKNTGSRPINGWTLSWVFPNRQVITQMWNASFTQSGTTVSAANLDWNATIAPGATQNLGFLATWSDTNGEPTNFILNGATCGVQ